MIKELILAMCIGFSLPFLWVQGSKPAEPKEHKVYLPPASRTSDGLTVRRVRIEGEPYLLVRQVGMHGFELIRVEE